MRLNKSQVAGGRISATCDLMSDVHFEMGLVDLAVEQAWRGPLAPSKPAPHHR